MFPEHPLGGNRIWVRFDLNCIPSGEFFFIPVRTYIYNIKYNLLCCLNENITKAQTINEGTKNLNIWSE